LLKNVQNKIEFNITVLRTLFRILNPVATNPSVAGQVFWCAAPYSPKNR